MQKLKFEVLDMLILNKIALSKKIFIKVANLSIVQLSYDVEKGVYIK